MAAPGFCACRSQKADKRRDQDHSQLANVSPRSVRQTQAGSQSTEAKITTGYGLVTLGFRPTLSLNLKTKIFGLGLKGFEVHGLGVKVTRNLS